MKTITGTRSGMELVEKWIERNKPTMSMEQMDGRVFVYGDDAYLIQKQPDGNLGIIQMGEKVVVFRNFREMEDECTCRICGTHYTSKVDTIRCCMNQDE